MKIIDATVIRMFLVPAVMKLLGDDCWWAPRWMRVVQRKIGLGETVLDEIQLYAHDTASTHHALARVGLTGLAEAHVKPGFSTLAGLVLYASSMWVSGIMEGLMWREVDSQGFLVNAFADTVVAKYPMLVVRTLGGVFFLLGAIIMCYNLWATVARQPRIADTRVAVPAE